MPLVYDLIIIGTGAAGTSAATRAHHLGATRIAMVERGPLWGTCVESDGRNKDHVLACSEPTGP